MISISCFFSIQLPTTFLTAQNIINISQQISMLAVAFSMTIVMVMNDFDLSVGSDSLSGESGRIVSMIILFCWQYQLLYLGVIGGTFNGILVAGLNLNICGNARNINYVQRFSCCEWRQNNIW